MFFLPSDLFHFIYFPFLILYTLVYFSFFFFNDTATTEIYTLSLHDALPISLLHRLGDQVVRGVEPPVLEGLQIPADGLLRGERGWSRDGRPHAGEERECAERSEEHTSELQSQSNLVCRLLLEKKKKKQKETA